MACRDPVREAGFSRHSGEFGGVHKTMGIVKAMPTYVRMLLWT
jgi:hypothetical protein